MSRTIVYTGKTHTTGGRNGASRSSDGELDIKLSKPGSPHAGTNPEQLFGSGWSACFLGAIEKAAAEREVKVPSDAAVDAEIDLAVDDSGYSLIGRLNVSLPGIDRQLSEAIAARAHELCPYSKATRGNIEVEISIL